MTKQKFIEYAQENAKRAGMFANLLDSDVAPCDCVYEGCNGWQIVVPPSMYLVPNMIITKLTVDIK